MERRRVIDRPSSVAHREEQGEPRWENLVIQESCVTRRPWDVDFTAHPEEVAALRRAVRLRLVAWGLHELVDTAQLCVSELVSNIVTHVGIGTPGSLAVSMNGTYLRIEVQDPDTRALPTLVATEGGAWRSSTP
jgi:hypothetical protein